MAILGPARYNLTVYKNTTFAPVFRWTDSDETPVNLTGYTIQFAARHTLTGADTITKNATITNAAEGLFTVALTPAETAALNQDSLYYSIEGTLGSDSYGIAIGTLTISAEVFA